MFSSRCSATRSDMLNGGGQPSVECRIDIAFRSDSIASRNRSRSSARAVASSASSSATRARRVAQSGQPVTTRLGMHFSQQT